MEPDPLFEIASPTALGSVQATPLQLHLLWSFVSPQTIDSQLERFVEHREECLAFLLRCRALGILRRSHPETGQAELPERVSPQQNFMGIPTYEPDQPPRFTVLGVPIDSTTTGAPGTRYGPSAIRAASANLRYTLDPLTQTPLGFYDYSMRRSILSGASFADAGDLYISPGEGMMTIYPRLSQFTRELIENGSIPIVLGGDHSITAAVLSAYQSTPLQIIHLDAHTDLGTLEIDGLHGLHHGNVFSYALKHNPNIKQIVQLGLRGFVEANIKTQIPKVHSIGMDVLRLNPDRVFDSLDPDIPTYLTIDIDVVDPCFAPHTGAPVPYGLYPAALKDLLIRIGEQYPLVGIDLVEVTGEGHGPNRTAAVAVDALIIASAATYERAFRDRKINS